MHRQIIFAKAVDEHLLTQHVRMTNLVIDSVFNTFFNKITKYITFIINHVHDKYQDEIEQTVSREINSFISFKN